MLTGGRVQHTLYTPLSLLNSLLIFSDSSMIKFAHWPANETLA